jgi:DNA-3-methyladenine glycosylase
VQPLKELLHQPASKVAPLLLGCELERKVNGQTIRVRIVETEAYDQTDAASHSFKGRTTRTDIMFGKPGYLYVYFTYGMHYCCNIVTDAEGLGSAVLIRAVEPIEGEDYMQKLRTSIGVELCNGPAKLCQALSIDKNLNGHDLELFPLRLVYKPALPASFIVQTRRVGISKAKDVPWRFYIAGNPYVSTVL